ncbi:uncharacterized protein LOC114284454 [Camellia sinensis]|uniref:uncharacterized protein LOC114284454 n=1 Tax=Camellia sinensis TaxID=4442 RepID=UPI001036CD25|nr:uncharacterized protein LOC114284454 [Camellia sinensis]
MDHTKGITGIGFDAEIGMFQASDEWWDRMELINKSCAKFRTKTLEHRELMEIVFTGAAATGRHHWTPGERTIEDNKGSSNSVQSLGMRPFTDLIPSVGIGVDAKSSMEGVEPAVDPGAKRKRNTPASSGKSRKPTSGASALADSVNNLSNVVRTKNQEVIVRHLTGNESLYTISECMDRLKSIPTLVGTPLFHFASSLMDNADYRVVMMCQPDDDHIIRWLTHKQLQSSTAAPFANLFSARQDFIGVIDGTYDVAKVTGPEAATYFGRKYCHTQNIMAVVDFDMCFMFVSLG